MWRQTLGFVIDRFLAMYERIHARSSRPFVGDHVGLINHGNVLLWICFELVDSLANALALHVLFAAHGHARGRAAKLLLCEDPSAVLGFGEGIFILYLVRCSGLCGMRLATVLVVLFRGGRYMQMTGTSTPCSLLS